MSKAVPSNRTAPPEHAEAPTTHPDAPPAGTELASHFHRCFGCGPEHPTGLHLASTVVDGRSVASRFTVTEQHQGAPGLAHGGLLAAAFDEALGALIWLLREPQVTGRLETDFQRPVPVGSTLHITARIDAVDKRKVYCSAEGRLDAPDGPVAVRSTAIFVRVDLSHFQTHGRPEDVEEAAAARAQAKEARATTEVNP